MAIIQLSRPALLDIQDIQEYSIATWGELVAEEYLQNIEDALNRLRLNPKLLSDKPEVSKSLCFYRVKQHFLVCAQFDEYILILTVKHGAMGLPTRIQELEPSLQEEANMLYQGIVESQGHS